MVNWLKAFSLISGILNTDHLLYIPFCPALIMVCWCGLHHYYTWTHHLLPVILSFQVLCELEKYLQVKKKRQKIGTPKFPASFRFLFTTGFIYVFFFLIRINYPNTYLYLNVTCKIYLSSKEDRFLKAF